MTAAVVTRFAPSPTGHLHLGHAYAALFAEAAARRAGGRFLLRIEDIDPSRARTEHEVSILEDLEWLGLRWETPVRRQSDHLADYAAALDRLATLDVIYPCFCTRAEIRAEIARSPSAPHGPDGALYPGTCRDLPPRLRAERVAAGEAYAMRLDAGRARDVVASRYGPDLSWHDEVAGTVALAPLLFGDVVLARRDAPTSYHLAVTVDDALQGVTLVTRGSDLLAATHVHRLLQALLQYPTPAYHHHRLITDDAGRRLATRDRATSLRTLRASGTTAADIRRRLGWP
jgi:glutamyl-Q tRNA(Asp) synthetase